MKLEVIGWREWVYLPDLELPWIKAKVDTGARSSALHAVNLEYFEQEGTEWVRFQVYPEQRKRQNRCICTAEILEHRNIKSSNGQTQKRPVILTTLQLMGQTYPIELTLSNREDMGFRMLLGRESFRGRFLVDAGRSYYNKKSEKQK